MIPAARQQHLDEYRSEPVASTLYVIFDATRPPFDDVRVRQAFIHAVDRKTIAEIVLHNSITQATGGFVPPGLPGHSPGIGLAYDPERAKHLLAGAGYPQGRGFPALEVWGPYVGDDPLWRYLQTQWREHLGLEVAWQSFEWNDYLKRLAARLPNMHCLGWGAAYPDPDCFLRTGPQAKYHCWHNAQYEQLLDAARRINDHAERLKFYQAADRLLMQEAVIMPLGYHQAHRLIKPWIKQYPVNSVYASYWKDVIIEPH
jgi:ABC-type oligopeptide transport system substrate-binding subunit